MSRRRNAANQIEQVPLTDASEVIANAATATSTLGTTAAATNVSTGRQGVRAGLRDLQDEGWALANPTEAAALKAYKAQNRVSGGMLAEQQRLQDRQQRIQGFLDTGVGPDGKALTGAKRKEFERRLKNVGEKLTKLTTTIDTRTQRVADYEAEVKAGAPDTAASLFRESDPEFYANVDRAQGIANTIGQVTPEGQAFLDSAGRGFTSRAIGTQQIQASRMGDFGRATSRDISAGQVEQGTLGQSLMQRAMSGIASGGRLNAEAARDATQSARQAFAARGLGTSGAAMGAELLNRDKYRRSREMEDLQFASGVQAQDLGRQFQNVGNQLNAAQANQGAAMQAELANLQARYNAAVQQGNWDQAAAIENAGNRLRADMFNEEARRLGTVTNNEMLYNAAGYADALKTQGLGASLQMAGVQQSANPLFRALAFDPYGTRGSGTNALGAASNLAGDVASLNSTERGFNVNAANWAKFQPSFNSGAGTLTGSAWGDFALNTGIQGAKTAAELYFAK